jgi:arylsulfatase A-like enzyme
MITLDTVRADHLSVYGYEHDTTPHLREFAKGATVYNRAIAASDMTLPSHASIFTGMYPSWHGAYAAMPSFPYGRPLVPDALTLAEVLRAKGYWTAAVVGNHSFLQASMGLAQGFAVWNHNMPYHISDSDRPFYLRRGARNLLSLFVSTAAFDAYFLRAADINRDAFRILKESPRQAPFFLFLNYMDAHIPLVPPAPFRDRFPGRDWRFSPASGQQDLTNEVNNGKRHVQDTEKRHLLSQYDGGIAYMDSEIADLLNWLREMGLYENTLIMITADHGEAFGDHDLMQHGVGSVYQEQVHVPLLIKYPDQHDGHRSDALVSHVDIMPTVLKAAGCVLPGGLQGRTLDLREEQMTEPVFAEASALGEVQANPRLRGFRRAIYIGSQKLIKWTAGASEMYNLSEDPAELKNQYRPDEPSTASLMARLTTWTDGISRRLSTPAKPDKATMDRIRSLGYIQK